MKTISEVRRNIEKILLLIKKSSNDWKQSTKDRLLIRNSRNKNYTEKTCNITNK